LANGTYCIFHGTRPDLSVTWIDEAVAELVRKDLEEGDGIFNPFEGRIQRVSCAIFGPDAPVGVCGGGARRYHSGSDRFLYKAEMTAELKCGGSVHSCHGLFCG
jgi:hypothetical protein